MELLAKLEEEEGGLTARATRSLTPESMYILNMIRPSHSRFLKKRKYDLLEI